jgi:Ala-tRNA(Pro) deacylase
MAAALGNAAAQPGWNEAATAFALAGVIGGCAGMEMLRSGATRARAVSKVPKPKREAAPPASIEPEVEDPETCNKLIEMLDAASIKYRRLDHEPVQTSEAAAAIRGVDLASGAKAMLFSANRAASKQAAAEAAGEPSHYLCILSAAKRLNVKAVRKLFGRSLRFANASELKEVAGCITGAVPPFGSLFRGGRVQTVVDRSVLDQGPTINFNCGLRTASVCDLAVADFLRLEAGHAIHDVSE